jgi:dethiobiotin synthetase
MASAGRLRFDGGAVKPTFFITGTDTGAGKTVLTALLARFLRGRGVTVAALKPLCSGGRADALALHDALGGALTLDEINPWHFRAALAPPLAAKREKKTVTLAAVRAHLCARRKQCDVLLVEGAGGLLSPLGENFNSRDLISALDATPVIVAQNKLGVVNHILLTLEALPKKLRMRAKVVLMSPARPDSATASNARLLGRFFPAEKIHRLAYFGGKFPPKVVLKKTQVIRTFQKLVH